MEGIKEKGFYNSVNDLFNRADCSVEYKAVVAEMLAYKFRMISDNQINKKLAETKENAENKKKGGEE